MPMPDEFLLLNLACVCYLAAMVPEYLPRRAPHAWLIAACTLGLATHSLSLAQRWTRVGHGPFINLYEILSSNLWSLMLGVTVFLLLARRHRAAMRYLFPLPALLMAWLWLTPAKDTYLPATYDTVWLYFHVVSGKFFLALLMLATGVAIYEARSRDAAGDPVAGSAFESTSYRLLAFAFCFESLMLLFGAVWAQDAWGRYWAWDPLETWAFVTWVSVIFVLHWRLSHSRRGVFALLVCTCLALAFLTFFGVPFISTAPHQGMI